MGYRVRKWLSVVEEIRHEGGPVPSATKVGAAGVSLDIPLAYKDALYVRSHYDTVTLQLPDAPRPGEIVAAVVLSSGGRVHDRLGGLARADARGDGLH